MLGMLATDYPTRRHELAICCADRKAQTAAALRQRKAGARARTTAPVTRGDAAGQPGHAASCAFTPGTISCC